MLSPHLQHKYLEARAEEVVQYTRRHGIYDAMDKFGVKDYMTLHDLMERHSDIMSASPESNPETVIDDLLSAFLKFLHARQQAIVSISARSEMGPPSQTEPIKQLEDPILAAARQLCQEARQISVSSLQRRLHVGYMKAIKLYRQLETEGIVNNGWTQKRRQEKCAEKS